MSPTSFTIRQLVMEAIIPKRQTDGAAGYDLHSASSGTIKAGTTGQIKTGLIFDIPYDHLGIIFGRSGLSLKYGLQILNPLIKNNKELVLDVFNSSNNDFEYKITERIAQIIFAKIDMVEYDE